MSPFARRVQRLVRRVPRGRVISYGAVAAMLGMPRAARAVGRALNTLDADDVPWWRVVNSAGAISPRGTMQAAQVQRALLEMEGVRFDRRGRIDWQRFGWKSAAHRAAGSDDDVAASHRRRTKQSVSLAIREPGRSGRILLVQRPPDDDDLPDAWGLPAATLRQHEAWADAARRTAREKLGVSVRVGKELRRGSLTRGRQTIVMRLFHATLARGTPNVPQATPDVTQYSNWRWGRPAELRLAAQRGSLCCRLALDALETTGRRA